MKFRFVAPAIGAALLVSASSLTAQVSTSGCDGLAATPACTLTNTASTTVATLVELTLSSLTTSLTAPVVTDFDGTGLAKKDDNGPSAHVRANTTWQVTVSSPSLWTATGGGNASKAAADLTWDKDAGTTYGNAMSTTATQLTNGGATAGSTPVQVKYRTLWHITTDTPGGYSLAVAYTVSAP